MLAKWARGLILTWLLAVPVGAVAVAQSGRGAQSDKPKFEQQQQQSSASRIQQRRMQNLKEALGCGEDEFKILEPKLERIMLIQYQQASGFSTLARRGRGGGAFGPFASLPPSEVQKARLSLQEVVENKTTTPAEILRKLKDLRAAREATRTELLRAEEDLRDFLTVRQEGVLVAMGLLE